MQKNEKKISILDKLLFVVKKIIHFFTHEIWTLGESNVSKTKSLIINLLKKIILSARGFFRSELLSKSASLAFYTVLAVVPTLALIVAIGRGFGFSAKIDSFIADAFTAQSELIPYITQFVNNYLEQASGGIFIGIGVVFLLWTVVSTFQEVEKNFNKIWNVNKSRSFFRQFTTYITVLLLAPILISLASGLSIYIDNQMSSVLGDFYSPINKILMRIAPLSIYWTLFSFLYFIVPNTKVKLGHAIFAGIICGTIFQIFQYLYINGQISLSRYNAVYGTFAAVPLFFFWLQISWLIVLYGAELSFVSQNLKDKYYEYEKSSISRRFFDYIILLITSIVIKQFKKNLPPLSAEAIANDNNIPIRLVRDAIKKLVETNILTEIPTEKGNTLYQPALDVNIISVGFVFDKIEKQGNENFDIKHNKNCSELWALVKEIKDKTFYRNENLLVKDL